MPTERSEQEILVPRGVGVVDAIGTTALNTLIFAVDQEHNDLHTERTGLPWQMATALQTEIDFVDESQLWTPEQIEQFYAQPGSPKLN